jgi:hypothetical protein
MFFSNCYIQQKRTDSLPRYLMATSSEAATQPPRNAADRLVVKLQTSWRDLSSCTARAAEAATVVQRAPSDPRNLQEMRGWYEETSGQLMMDPLERFLRLQPIKNALDALSMRDPEIPARALNSRAQIDRKFQRILIVTALDLPERWRIFRAGNNAAESQSWQKRRETHNKEATAVLDRYARWAQKMIGEEKKRIQAPRDPRNDLWWRQHRALSETLKVEMAWRDVTLAWFSATGTLISDVSRESEEARSYRAATLRWLEEGAPFDPSQDSSFAFITPEERGPPFSRGSRSGVGRYRSGSYRLGGRKICSVFADWRASMGTNTARVDQARPERQPG